MLRLNRNAYVSTSQLKGLIIFNTEFRVANGETEGATLLNNPNIAKKMEMFKALTNKLLDFT